MTCYVVLKNRQRYNAYIAMCVGVLWVRSVQLGSWLMASLAATMVCIMSWSLWAVVMNPAS